MPIFPLFDTYVMVDWSASNTRAGGKPKSDAIWWAVHPLEDARPWFEALEEEKQHDCNDCVSYLDEGVQVYEQTRHRAIENIQKFLLHVAKKRRVLIGFDFAFGYPGGFARIFTHKGSAPEMWRWISERIIDTHENSNNRFAVAGELNREIVRRVNMGLAAEECRICYGPFWGAPNERDCVPLTDPYGHSRRDWPMAQFGFGPKRFTEEVAARAQSAFKLHYTGSVGSQVLMGMPYLQYLRSLLRTTNSCAVWPIDTGFSIQPKDDGPQIVIVEIYPSLLGKKKDLEPHMLPDHKEILDRAQVRLSAKAFSLLDAKGELEALFGLPETTKNLSKARMAGIRKEEGWIFGVPYEREIRSVLKEGCRGDGLRGTGSRA